MFIATCPLLQRDRSTEIYTTMTLTEINENTNMQKDPQHNPNIGSNLREAIWQGLEQERLTCGMLDCAKLLESNPENVMICVIPEAVDDVTVHIHQTLIVAFCLENGIRLVRVDSADKLLKLVSGRKGTKPNDNDVVGGRAIGHDAGCVIVQYPEDSLSAEEDVVMQWIKAMMYASDGPTAVVNISV
ncbi:uncharacterized protein LOC121375279 [Gigantopelta aegis]|uniref:uncharacterized protein LOC121375279 n=1 Tax=Gigantopelta aegis TaxID=1735272 RepID=UPI001B88CDF7|nr:uncharacterized protein LOC121375279 [Gigantopelta aegis]